MNKCVLVAACCVCKIAVAQQPMTFSQAVVPKAPEAAPTALQLAPLELAPGVQVNFDSKATVLPSVHAQGGVFVSGDNTSVSSFLWQVRLDVNAPPSAGSAEQVSSRVKTMPGTANVDMGVRWTWTPRSLRLASTKDPSQYGNFGIQARVGATAGIQVASQTTTIPPTSTSGVSITGDTFGLFSAQGTLAFYLWFVYLAGQVNYYGATGPSALAQSLRNSVGLNASLVVPVMSSNNKQIYYFQFLAGGDKNHLIWGVNAVASFQPLGG